MAVCRGKVAEGLDFADDNGRAVLITGLPYPPFKDARVELKRQFLDEQLRNKSGSMTGQKWYQLEAFRATNQAVGRVIRHSRDHGAVVFLDTRFGDPAAKACLSKWLQPHFSKYSNFGAASKSLAAFFKVDSSVGQMRREAVQRQTELMQKSNSTAQVKGIKRSHGSSDDNDDVKPNAEVLQDIYNVDCKKDPGSVAASIYAQSSQGISFASHSKDVKNEGKVQIHSLHKKKKIKLATSKCVSFDDSETVNPGSSISSSGITPASSVDIIRHKNPDRQDTNVAKSYIKRLKATLNSEEMSAFKNCIQKYKSNNDFQDLTPVLMSIVKKQVEGDSLLEEFKVFLKGKDLSEFHLFCTVTAPKMLESS